VQRHPVAGFEKGVVLIHQREQGQGRVEETGNQVNQRAEQPIGHHLQVFVRVQRVQACLLVRGGQGREGRQHGRVASGKGADRYAISGIYETQAFLLREVRRSYLKSGTSCCIAIRQAAELALLYRRQQWDYRRIAAQLTASGYHTRRGCAFTAAGVRRLLLVPVPSTDE